MTTIFTILTVLAVIAGILLIIVVLLQNGKGEGLASNFVAGNQTFGVRQTADMLEKVTWGLVAFVLIVAVVSSFTVGTQNNTSSLTEQIEQAASSERPAFPAAPIQQANPVAAPATNATTTEKTQK